MLKLLTQNLRLPKPSQKVWITPKELSKYTAKVIWITRSHRHKDAFIILVNRIRTLIKRSGFQFTFLYLKEAMRLVIRSLSGNPEPKFLKGVMVKRDHTGLPTIIPLTLRKALRDYRENQRLVVCILSVISVFRVFPTKVKPSLDTITAPFDGITRTINSSAIKLALAELTTGSFNVKSPTLVKLESAGPNAVKSAWGASVDAVAFFDHPYTLYRYIQYMYYQKSYQYILWLLIILLISSVTFVILRAGGWLGRLNMGKLGVVYDQAGKARVVAITNWWIQLALKPLHNALFKLLKSIKEDGTFDQMKPFNKLLEVESEEKFFSFDLSAATDRLPIELQRDILNCLSPNLGTAWSNLLDFGWFWKGKEIKYAVGQPMGAYSSWAMLALTHHVIVRISAQRVGLLNFSDYCILGDDVVIRNSAVADEYYNLMKSLGVSINLSKSVNSYEFAEFAKNWKGPGVQITPIGPGLTLRLVRDKKYTAAYILEAWKLSILSHFSEVLARVEDIRDVKKTRSETLATLWSSFGLNGYTFGLERYINDKTMMYCFSSMVTQMSALEYRLYTALRGLAYDDIREAKEKLQANEEHFYQNWWKTFATRSWPLRLLEAILKLVGPGFWIYATSFDESRTLIEEREKFISSLSIDWDSIWKLVSEDPQLNLSTIDWTQKKLIKDNSVKTKRLIRAVQAFEIKSFYDKSEHILGKTPIIQKVWY